MNIVFKGCPNFSKRTKPIRKIVIHWFGLGTLESANTRFQNAANQVSAHYGISKGRIWQWVKETDVAWHSGVSTVNGESIGIEHDATTDHNLSEQDYQLSGQLVAEISKRHNIPLNRQYIIGHREVKATQCPGTIDIDKIIKIAQSYLNPVPTFPIKIRAKLVINGPEWATAAQKCEEVRQWYLTHSQNKLDLEFTVSYSNFSSIPFHYLPNGSAIIDEAWFDANVLDSSFPTTIFIIRDEDYPDNMPGGKQLARTSGYMAKFQLRRLSGQERML